jgi:hypothetical protein
MRHVAALARREDARGVGGVDAGAGVGVHAAVLGGAAVVVDVAAGHAEAALEARRVGVEADAEGLVGAAVGVAVLEGAVAVDLGEVALAVARGAAVGAGAAAVADDLLAGPRGESDGEEKGERAEGSGHHRARGTYWNPSPRRNPCPRGDAARDISGRAVT